MLLVACYSIAASYTSLPETKSQIDSCAICNMLLLQGQMQKNGCFHLSRNQISGVSENYV